MLVCVRTTAGMCVCLCAHSYLYVGLHVCVRLHVCVLVSMPLVASMCVCMLAQFHDKQFFRCISSFCGFKDNQPFYYNAHSIAYNQRLID